jgi:hypothetical protein
MPHDLKAPADAVRLPVAPHRRYLYNRKRVDAAVIKERALT